MNAERVQLIKSLMEDTMTSLQRYHSANLPELMKIISKNGIGMDDYLDRFFNSFETTTNYPPYNLIHVNNVCLLYTSDAADES